MPIIDVKKITKSFIVGTQKIEILHGIDFGVNKGNFSIIFGPSGSGKSTLLHTILGLEEPDTGTVQLLGEEMYKGKSEDDRAEFRKNHVGMVYQQPHWVKSINVLANVAMPLFLLGEEKESRLKKAMDALKMIKMEGWAHHHPSELSSGQQQKVSLARALITDPEILIADEPTGNLDFESGQELMKLLKDLSKRLQKTVLMVTHDLGYLKYADEAVKVIDGQIVKDISRNELITKYREVTLGDVEK